MINALAQYYKNITFFYLLIFDKIGQIKNYTEIGTY